MAWSLTPVNGTGIDRQMLFALYKSELYAHIDHAFGWDEAFQQARFEASYPDADISLIKTADATAGLVALNDHADSLHLSLLLLHARFQNRGIGEAVMQGLISRAGLEGRPLTLSCFSRNTAAMRFYERLGFRVVSTDEHFVSYRLGDH